MNTEDSDSQRGAHSPLTLSSLASSSYYLSPRGFRVRTMEGDMVNAQYGSYWAGRGTRTCPARDSLQSSCTKPLSILNGRRDMRKPSRGLECSSPSLMLSWVGSIPECQPQGHPAVRREAVLGPGHVNKLSAPSPASHREPLAGQTEWTPVSTSLYDAKNVLYT